MINKEKELPLFNYFPPQNKFVGILSIPHSGEILPEEFRPYLTSNFKDLMQDVDYKVHELVDIKQLTEKGVAVIYSNIIRTAVDLNREYSTAVLNWKKNTKGKEIVTKIASDEQTRELTEKYYSPYYEMLNTLILELQQLKKTPPLVDLHSMPSRPTEYHLKTNPNQKMIRPHFCISDRIGKSCEKAFIDFISHDLKIQGYDVSQNDPYIGGNITDYLNQNYHPLNNIQIEISREIYMDEDKQELIAEKVSELRPKLTSSLLNLFESF